MDESRNYRDPRGVVHRSSDLGRPDSNHITFCERYDLGFDQFESDELAPTDTHLTCLRCIHISHVFMTRLCS